MSTPEQFGGIQAEHPATRSLFQALFDDAAVFPPGLAPLPQAVIDHVARRSRSYADLVGPLLLPALLIEDFFHAQRSQHPDLTVVGRPDTDLALIRRYAEALAKLGKDAGDVVGFEIAWSPDWHQSLSLGLPVSVEVPSGSDQARCLSDIRAHAGEGNPVRAKFRTGSTPQRPVPTPTELATFIHACLDQHLGFKLTGGLHHAISRTTTDGEDQFGFLNVIAATHRALARGAGVSETESLLSQRDPAPIVDFISQMSEPDASTTRTFFTAYGCCGVMDPIGDLASLGLIKEKTV